MLYAYALLYMINGHAVTLRAPKARRKNVLARDIKWKRHVTMRHARIYICLTIVSHFHYQGNGGVYRMYTLVFFMLASIALEALICDLNIRLHHLYIYIYIYEFILCLTSWFRKKMKARSETSCFQNILQNLIFAHLIFIFNPNSYTDK